MKTMIKTLAVAVALFVGLSAVADPATSVKRRVCKHFAGPTQFKDHGDIWWGHRGAAFGNHLKFAKADIPEWQCPPPPFDAIYFDLDKSDLRPEGETTAGQVVDYLKFFPEKGLVIEGHCCDWASNDYNIGLGNRRATSVKKYLTDRGIDGDRVETVTYGEEMPAVPNNGERELNRRAMVKVKGGCAGEAGCTKKSGCAKKAGCTKGGGCKKACCAKK